MREVLGPPQERYAVTDQEIHGWWDFIRAFLHDDTEETGAVSVPFTVLATQTLRANTLAGES